MLPSVGTYGFETVGDWSTDEVYIPFLPRKTPRPSTCVQSPFPQRGYGPSVVLIKEQFCFWEGKKKVCYWVPSQTHGSRGAEEGASALMLFKAPHCDLVHKQRAKLRGKL